MLRMRVARGALWIAVLLLMVGGAAGGVAAETKADRLHKKMIELFKAGKYRETVDVTKRLYELTKKAKYLVNIGTCFDQLKDDEQAIHYYQKFLREDATSPLRPRIGAKVEEIRTRLSQHKREVSFVTEPSGAELVIDGRTLLTTPVTVWLTFGKHQVELRKPGHVTKRVTLTVASGPLLQRDYKLEMVKKVAYLVVNSNVDGARVFIGKRLMGLTPLPRTAIEPGSYMLRVVSPKHREWRNPVTLETNQATVVQADLTLSEVVSSGTSVKKMRLAGWILLGIGAALVVSGGAVHGLGYKKIKDANDQLNPKVKAGTAVQADFDSYNSKYTSGTNMYKAAYALYGIGGAALVTSVVLLVVKPKSAETITSQRFRLVPSLGPTSVGLDAQLRF